jgi:hypothetical protein
MTASKDAEKLFFSILLWDLPSSHQKQKGARESLRTPYFIRISRRLLKLKTPRYKSSSSEGSVTSL